MRTTEEQRGDHPPIELLLTDQRGWAESPHASASPGRCRPRRSGARPRRACWPSASPSSSPAGEAAAGGCGGAAARAGDLPVYERALEERGLRTLAAVGSFWGHQQVGDLLAWLRALANPLDELALYSVLASPLVGLSSDGSRWSRCSARRGEPERGRRVGQASARRRGGCGGDGDAMRTRSAERPAVHAHLGHRPRAPGALRRAFRRRARAAADAQRSPSCCCARSPHSGYERHVLSLPWGERRLANIHKLLRLARRFEAARGSRPAGLSRPRRAPPRRCRAPSPRPRPAPSPTRCA